MGNSDNLFYNFMNVKIKFPNSWNGLSKSRFFQNAKVIMIYALIGAGIFYFILHPFSMVVYWFNNNGLSFSFSLFLNRLFGQILHSFSFHMAFMSIVFAGTGAWLGVVIGLVIIKINNKRKRGNLRKQHFVNDILDLINQGENDSVEFKSSLRYDYYNKMVNKNLEQVICKTVVGFLNTNGGELLIGVGDHGEILGIENDYKSLKKKNKDGFELKLYELISTHIGKTFSQNIKVDFYNIKGKDICWVQVTPAKVPAYYIDPGNTIFYVRTGNATNPLTVKQAIEYVEMKKEAKK
jgi:Schlafen, AlbA_2